MIRLLRLCSVSHLMRFAMTNLRLTYVTLLTTLRKEDKRLIILSCYMMWIETSVRNATSDVCDSVDT